VALEQAYEIRRGEKDEQWTAAAAKIIENIEKTRSGIRQAAWSSKTGAAK